MHRYTLSYFVNRIVVLLFFACLHYSHAYDKCGRVTRITHDYDKVEEQTYSYYSSGRLQEAKNEHALVSLRYDNMGLPVEERCNEHRILRTYDKLGQISTLTSSLGANLTYERNEFGELINFRAQQGETENHFVSEHQYDSLGFELERMLPGGIRQSFAYDNIGRLVNSKTRQSSKVRRERKYHWGKADRLLKTEDSWYGTTTYEYSATGHLQKATYADGREEYRLSDKVGNLFDDPERKLRKYLQGGKIEQSGEWHFEYDKDGQLTEKYKGSGKWWDTKRERWRYEWNQNGTLKAVKSPHRTNRVEFTYDALGRRTAKLNVYGRSDKHTITRFLWDGDVPLHEWTYPLSQRPDTVDDNEGWRSYQTPEPQTELTTWIFDEGTFVPSAKLVGDRRYSIISDYLGTPVETYDEEGRRVWQRELDIYGRTRVERGEVGLVPFLYQGQYLDTETGLAYNRFRYYSPETGAYISQDPIRLEAGLTNLYAYVHDTNAWVDVLGLKGTGVSFQVGLHEDLIKINAGTGLDSHHVGQKTIMDKLVANYNEMKAPAILVPSVGHTRAKDGVGIVSRSKTNPKTGKPFASARELLARDIIELRRVYGDAISNKQLQELIELNKSMYPELRKQNTKTGCP